MARPIVLSNGELHVGLNNYGVVHDFYYPYVGFENHAAGEGLRHKVGVWINGTVYWTDQPGWTFDFSYPDDTLVGYTVALNKDLEVLIEFTDFVDTEMSTFMRNINVTNLSGVQREIRLFMYQAFAIGDSRSNTDTAQYLPDSNAVLHYRGRRAFVVSGESQGKPFDQHTIGLFGIENHEGSYKDAEDGELGCNTVDHGRVDSILRFAMDIPAGDSVLVRYWISAGMSTREALYVHKQVSEDGIAERLQRTTDWWHQWMEPAVKVSEKLPAEHRKLFKQSVMIIKSQIDKRGATIASTDSSMLNYSRDAYAYSWPRDGAHVMWPLVRMGYYQEAYRFFEFCQRGLHPSGYLMHKYRADGALGSSWHPYVQGNTVVPPIQEDETALVVSTFVQFYQLSKDSSLIRDFYHSLIRPMANFMADYIDKHTGLPKPTYDLWEERFATFTYTTALVYGALVAASELAQSAGDDESSIKWRTAASGIQESARRHLYNEDRGVFYKSILADENGFVTKDETIDNSAIYGSFMFGLFDFDGKEVKSSIAKAAEVFGTSDEKPGLPRYENDPYRRTSDELSGNWWHICTLWRAQYDIQNGDTPHALAILKWVNQHALSTGMLSEQINPVDNSAVAPAPLTWSHAEYISTLLDTIDHGRE